MMSVLHDVVYDLTMFLAATTLLRTEAHINTLFSVILLATLAVVVVVFAEIMAGHNLFSAYAADPEVAVRLVTGETRSGHARVFGTFANPLALAAYMCFAIPIMLNIIFKGRNLMSLFLAAFTMAGALVALYNTDSRGGLVVLALTLALLTFLVLRSWLRRIQRSKRAAALALSLFVIAAIGFTVAQFVFVNTQGTTTAKSRSSDERATQIAEGTPLIESNPLLGYGAGRAVTALNSPANTVDNYYLTLALESGLPGLLLFVTLEILLLTKGMKLIKRQWSGRTLSVYVVLSIVGNVVFMFVLSLTQVVPLLFLFYGLVIVLGEMHRVETTTVCTRRDIAPMVSP